MNYIDGFINAFPPAFDDEESQNEAAAQKQMALDILYEHGCKYSVKTGDMMLLCALANININELMNYSPKLNESTKCQSQLSSLATPVLANQQAFAT